MTFGVNTSPLSGRDGKFVTSRQIKDRLEREVLGNVSIEVLPTASPDTYEVRGRGELQLAVLIEQMRREGFELQVSRPEVLLREIDGETHEPYERITIDIPPEFIGPVSQSLADRKARMELMSTDADGRARMEFTIPTRGLVGYRGQLLTETRGTALMHQHHAGWTPWVGDLPTRKGGAMLADRSGKTTGFALDNLQQRGEMFVGPGEAVYEGMIVGENARPDDMNVNIVREKQKTNIRTHSADEAIKLTPPKVVTLESGMEFIAEDELVEVTPESVRIRKRVLKEQDRRRLKR
jgi:GTP-binding protein